MKFPPLEHSLGREAWAVHDAGFNPGSRVPRFAVMAPVKTVPGYFGLLGNFDFLPHAQAVAAVPLLCAALEEALPFIPEAERAAALEALNYAAGKIPRPITGKE